LTIFSEGNGSIIRADYLHYASNDRINATRMLALLKNQMDNG